MIVYMGLGEADDGDRDVRKLVEDRLVEVDELAAVGPAIEGAIHRLNNPLAALMLDLEQLCEQIAYVVPTAERSDAARTLGEARAQAARLAEGIKELAKLVPRDQPKRVELHDTLLSVLHLVERQYGGRVCIHRRLAAAGAIITREARFGLLVRNLVQVAIAEARAVTKLERVDIAVVAGKAEGAVSLRVGPRSRASLERASAPSNSFAPPPFSVPPPAVLEVAQDPVLTGLAQQLGGSMHVDRGTYVLTLPTEMPSADDTQKVPRKRPSAPELGEIRVLVVDDEVSIQRALARALRDLGVVQAVSSVRSAVELLSGGAVFDVVLCDVVMPEQSGIELVTWLQQHRPRLRRRVVLMSGLESAHADAHPDVPTVQKPFDLAALRELLCELAVRA